MKHAEVVPLYKSGPKNETTNYRPISLLLTLSKILEKVMYKRIYNFLNVDQLFKSQYGFRSQHSCEDAITELTLSITKNWENNKRSIAVFIDLSKAFDTLQHEVLFNKLKKYGIRGNTLKWFQSYLSDRTMSAICKIKGDDTCTISEKFGVNIGSPQGSCLGHLLFLIFNNRVFPKVDHSANIVRIVLNILLDQLLN